MATHTEAIAREHQRALNTAAKKADSFYANHINTLEGKLRDAKQYREDVRDLIKKGALVDARSRVAWTLQALRETQWEADGEAALRTFDEAQGLKLAARMLMVTDADEED